MTLLREKDDECFPEGGDFFFMGGGDKRGDLTGGTPEPRTTKNPDLNQREGGNDLERRRRSWPRGVKKGARHSEGGGRKSKQTQTPSTRGGEGEDLVRTKGCVGGKKNRLPAVVPIREEKKRLNDFAI